MNVSLHNTKANTHTMFPLFCGHGGHTAPYVRSGVVAKNISKSTAAIASSKSVNEIAMNANTMVQPFCGHGGHTSPCVRSGVIAKDAVKSVAAGWY